MAWQIETARFPEHACSDTFGRFAFVRHAVTTRGRADTPYNLSLSIGDDRDAVIARREAVAEMLGYPAGRLLVPRQVHGNFAAIVDHRTLAPGALPLEADAVVTHTPGLLLGITAADCLPVLFVEPEARVVGLAHSGWRGTAANIVAATLRAMQSIGARPERCMAAIGPGISGWGYEVDSAVFESFEAPLRDRPGVFTPARDGHYRLDLTAAVTYQLIEAGVLPEAIDASPWRTDQRLDLFTSHRLSPGCARFGAFIGLML